MKAWKMSVAAMMVCAAGAMACPDKENCSAADKAECSKQAAAADTASLTLVSGEAQPECSAHALLKDVSAKKSECSQQAGVQQISADKTGSCCAKGGSKAAALLTVAAQSPDKAQCSLGKASFKQVAAKDMPTMLFVVGSEKTSCSITAAKMVEADGATMGFEVGGKAFENKSEAYQAHTVALNKYLDSMTRVSFVVGDERVDCPFEASAKCEASGQALKYRVGPAVFASAEKAIRAAAMAYGASQQVSMTYSIGETNTTCSVTASECSKDTGKAIEYVVGDQRTDCPVTAAEYVAAQRVQAALDAIESTQG